MEKKYYSAIDGLRMIAALGIVMMHIKANTDYQISGFVYEKVIPSFTNFVFLFMTISAFGMCCGYYEKVLHNEINWSEFYRKRFVKVLPFFTILVFLDILMFPSLSSIYEAFADMTLLFGFLPGAGNISVIGVGWFLGLIFVFYLIFPFFCVLLENKRRAWLAFAVSLIYNFVCAAYFEVGRSNILYSGVFFLAGGSIYLYRERLSRLNKWLAFGAVAFSVVLYYIVGGNTLLCLLVSTTLLIYAVINEGGVLGNRAIRFFSSISMEIYLSHMVVFRMIEKFGLTRVLGDGWLQYIAIVVAVLVGATVFAVVVRKIIEKVTQAIKIGEQNCARKKNSNK